MSLEAWSTVASLATLIIITATAIAALAQMRHMRSSNQIAAVTEMRETMESKEFKQARRFVAEELPKLIADPAARRKFGEENLPAELEAIRQLANFFETMGVFVKLGIVDRELVADLWDGVVRPESAIAIDHYPRGMPRMAVDKRSLDATEAFLRDETEPRDSVTLR